MEVATSYRRVDLVGVLDVSYSMYKSLGDFVPSKIEAAKEVMLYVASRVLEVRGSRVGLVVFHGRAAPVLPLTSSYREVLRAVSMIDFAGEGSAMGDGIVEAVKMLRGSMGEKRVLVLTDGGVNEGLDPRAAALYARYSRTRLFVLVIGGALGREARALLDYLDSRLGAEVYYVDSRAKLLGSALRAV